ncbi:hypothetical protein CVS37_29630 [Burkholderia lata]|nr:hypothetical protein CVS37_29630 [Burkholderia lata]
MLTARYSMRKQVSASSSIDSYSCEPTRSDDSSISGNLIRVDEIKPEERWRHITQSLSACSDGSSINIQIKDCTVDLRRKITLGDRSKCRATIDILDQPTPSTAVLSWRDSTGGHYGYQLWHKGCARRPGLCAVSGMPINLGDEIFRPSVRNGRPTNWSAMILAIHISRIDFAQITK